MQRARPVILTALAAILAFIPLTQSVFWGTLAYTLIGGTLRRVGSDPGVLAGLVRDLVQDQAGGGGRASRSCDANGTCRGLADGIGAPAPQDCRRAATVTTLQGTRHPTLAQAMVWLIIALPRGASTFDVCFEPGRTPL